MESLIKWIVDLVVAVLRLEADVPWWKSLIVLGMFCVFLVSALILLFNKIRNHKEAKDKERFRVELLHWRELDFSIKEGWGAEAEILFNRLVGRAASFDQIQLIWKRDWRRPKIEVCRLWKFGGQHLTLSGDKESFVWYGKKRNKKWKIVWVIVNILLVYIALLAAISSLLVGYVAAFLVFSAIGVFPLTIIDDIFDSIRSCDSAYELVELSVKTINVSS